jgi:hypothetical protein
MKKMNDDKIEGFPKWKFETSIYSIAQIIGLPYMKCCDFEANWEYETIGTRLEPYEMVYCSECGKMLDGYDIPEQPY